ncbi:MAG: hypothetical protein KAR39_01095 [Thermoplasmata archaeon]|nr:hypothetical protein [Thermoplasmata archaeon]
MKKLLFALMAASLMAIPFMSFGTVATIEEVVDYDTGIKEDASYVDDARVEWEIISCRWVAQLYEVSIEYRHTTPWHAAPGGFLNHDPPTVGRDFVVYPGQEEVPFWDQMGVWFGYAEFTSFINPDAKHGINHGDIIIHYPDTPYTCSDNQNCEPDYGYLVYWSFNIHHRSA